MPTIRSALLPLAVLLALPLPAGAADQSPVGPTPTSSRPPGVRVDWAVDGSITLATGGAWIASELAKSYLVPPRCRWCAPNRLDDSVTHFLEWKDLDRANLVGNLGAFAVVPLAVAGTLSWAAVREDRISEMPANALLILEAVAVSSMVNQVTKFSLARERPFVAALPADQKGGTADPADNNVSFFSGHSNLVFAMAVSAGTVAHMRGYRAEPLIWAVGLPAASVVAYSRIAAGKHYLSDVLLGSAAGAALGFAIPWYFHRGSQATPVTVSASPSQVSVAFAF